ncbi:nucleotide exchange factor GrpE [bacterium]|nr:nucleotide exchange factor GrpE [bacterium]
MWNWKEKLLPDEFVIDEQPLEVYRPDDTTVAVAEVGESPDAEQPASAAQDLLTQVMQILVDQDNLARKARFLETRQVGNDEFGRFVRGMLPFMDNFSHLLDLAREHAPSEELTNWLSGVEALYFRIVSLMESYGLRFINSTGKLVNFDIHDVVEYRRTNQYPHNTVIKELQKGVVFRDRLLREAKVVVACNE